MSESSAKELIKPLTDLKKEVTEQIKPVLAESNKEITKVEEKLTVKKKDSTIKKIFIFVFSFIFHLLAIALIFYLILPIAQWYLGARPAKGVDLWLSGTFVSKLLSGFALPFQKWRDYSYGGDPSSIIYPFLYFYLMIPFARTWGIIKGIQLFALAGLFIFGAFSYLLYQALSRNRVLAILLALVTLYSANLYRALIWAGGIPFWTSQSFYPLVLLCIVKFCQKNQPGWLYMAAVVTGLGLMGHPQGFLNLTLPATFVLIIFWREKEKISIKRRLFDLIQFGLLTYLVALPEMVHLYTPAAFLALLISSITQPMKMASPSSTGGLTPGSPGFIPEDVVEWTKNQFNVVFTDTNNLLWYLLIISLALFFISLVIRKKRIKAVISFIPFSFIAILPIGSIYLMSRGISLFIGGWYKAFWLVLPAVATLTAFSWGESSKVFEERHFFQKKLIKVVKWLGIIAVNCSLVGLGFLYLVPAKDGFFKKLEANDNLSSAFPDTLNLVRNSAQLKQLAQQLKPKLMGNRVHDFRLYIIDATVNIWWPALEDVALTRGYIDPFLASPERGSIFWLDAALGPSGKDPQSSLIVDWHTPASVADNNLKYLLDWSATKYLEGNHLSANNSQFASNIISDKFIANQEKVVVSGGIVNRYLPGETWSAETKEELNFYEMRDELVTPILMATNAAPILHIGDDQGYDTLNRFLGMLNLGPRQVVLARGPKFIDDISLYDLANFEAIILYRYDYRNRLKAWNLIGKYADKGGKVFVETGAEGRDSDTVKYGQELPAVFPIKNTTRGDLGKDWEYWYANVPATKGIKFNQFTKLDFDGAAWNISHPRATQDLKENAQVILKQKNFPILVKGDYGEGKVIWSGFNLPYHLIRDYNWQEAYFFRNLLAELVTLKGGLVEAKSSWLSAELRQVDVPQAKGIILKENGYDGWQATLDGRSLKIYKVGPSYPGYIYVRLSKNDSGKLSLKYNGSVKEKLYYAVSLLAILLVLDYLLGKRFIIKPVQWAIRPLLAKTKKWWAKEDEY